MHATLQTEQYLEPSQTPCLGRRYVFAVPRGVHRVVEHPTNLTDLIREAVKALPRAVATNVAFLEM